jgi:hypothetical protein
VAASVIVAVLVMLSLILAVTTFFPGVDARALTADLSGALALGLLLVGLLQLRRRGAPQAFDPVVLADKATWRMPPLAELTKPVWSTTRTVGMYTLRCYLLLAVLLLIAKVVALAISGQGAGAG